MKLVFKDDSTMRYSFRLDDMLVWFRFNNIFTNDSLAIRDIWKLKNGDYATLTNRWDDLPTWFELHPLEVQNLLVYKMKQKLNNGYTPGPIMDGPNIWRINAGDILVWFGKTRSDLRAEEGVLSIIKFNSNALLIGESTNYTEIEDAIGFGSIKVYTEGEIEQLKAILVKLREEGLPRTYATKWGLGV